MGNTNKTEWNVSVTPKIKMDLVDGVNVEKEVLNENVRRRLGGVGVLIAANNDIKINTSSASATNGVDNAGSTEGTSGWANGTYGYVTSNATTISVNTGTDLVVIKNSGFLYDSSATNNISTTAGTPGLDTVRVRLDASATANLSDDYVGIAELDCGEAIVIPRPASTYGLLLSNNTSSVGEHMACEVTVFGTNVGD